MLIALNTDYEVSLFCSAARRRQDAGQRRAGIDRGTGEQRRRGADHLRLMIRVG